MKRRALVAAVIAVMTLGTGLVVAGGPGFGGPGEYHMGRFGRRGAHGILGRMARVLHQLDLSDQQRTQVRAILDSARPEFQNHMQAMRNRREQLRGAQPGQLDEAAVRAIAQQQGQEMAEMIVLGEKVRSQVYSVLTPEQKQKLADIRQRMQQRRDCCAKCAGAAQATAAGK